MFEVGDIAKIVKPREGCAMQDSPAMNLVDSIVRIKNRYLYSNYNEPKYKYTLEFVEVHAKKPELFREEQGCMAWKDIHLEHVEELDVNENDTMALFEN